MFETVSYENTQTSDESKKFITEDFFVLPILRDIDLKINNLIQKWFKEKKFLTDAESLC